MKYLYRIDNDLSTEELLDLHTTKYLILKETEKGYWIMVYSKRKFVLKGSNGKRYAYISEKDALNGFIKRKEAQIKINKKLINRARFGIDLANKKLTDNF
jgi:hypothetical protein